jgi:4a-hydroxytetrahydrobiopterin dehydratase
VLTSPKRNAGLAHLTGAQAGSARIRRLGAILRNVSDRWTEVDGALEREFRFDDFAQALAFVNRVAELAEAANHHPDIEVHFNRVKLRWWTHSAGGITEHDHELAARTSELI